MTQKRSQDNSWDTIQKLAKNDKKVANVRLSKNFRSDGGLTASLELPDKDAIILMASDGVAFFILGIVSKYLALTPEMVKRHLDFTANNTWYKLSLI